METAVAIRRRRRIGNEESQPLPATVPGAPDPPHGSPRPASDGTPARHRELTPGPTAAIRLLIADDHPVVRQGLELLFGMVPGVEVVGLAADGRQAVDLADTLTPDVVLMDIGMPVLDGIEATRRMTSARPDLPVVVLTGDTDPERLHQALLAGARRCLFKHGDDREVIDAVLRAADEDQ